MAALAKNNNKTTLKEQLWEHSPKENWELIKVWAEKYKPTLKWAVPVICIYGAYRILNSNKAGINIDNIANMCEKECGLVLDELKDKRQLKKLLALGGLTATAYTAMKAVSAIYTKQNPDELCIEDVEKNMGKLEGVSEKFAWLQPKTEEFLPVAIAVIIAYVLTQKELPFGDKVNNKVKLLTEDWKIKAETYREIAELWVNDKFNIDLSSKEDKAKIRKFAFLAGIVTVIGLLYGKKMLDRKHDGDDNETETDKPLKTLTSEILNTMEKLVPALFGAIVSGTLLNKFLEKEVAIDEEFNAQIEHAEEVIDGTFETEKSDEEETKIVENDM